MDQEDQWNRAAVHQFVCSPLQHCTSFTRKNSRTTSGLSRRIDSEENPPADVGHESIKNAFHRVLSLRLGLQKVGTRKQNDLRGISVDFLFLFISEGNFRCILVVIRGREIYSPWAGTSSNCYKHCMGPNLLISLEYPLCASACTCNLFSVCILFLFFIWNINQPTYTQIFNLIRAGSLE